MFHIGWVNHMILEPIWIHAELNWIKISLDIIVSLSESNVFLNLGYFQADFGKNIQLRKVT